MLTKAQLSSDHWLTILALPLTIDLVFNHDLIVLVDHLTHVQVIPRGEKRNIFLILAGGWHEVHHFWREFELDLLHIAVGKPFR